MVKTKSERSKKIHLATKRVQAHTNLNSNEARVLVDEILAIMEMYTSDSKIDERR